MKYGCDAQLAAGVRRVRARGARGVAARRPRGGAGRAHAGPGAALLARRAARAGPGRGNRPLGRVGNYVGGDWSTTSARPR